MRVGKNVIKTKVNVRLSRVSGHSDYFELRVEDENTHLLILEAKLDDEAFANLLSNRSAALCDAEVDVSGDIGKVKESRELVFEVPSYMRGKEYAEENCHKFALKGWTADNYFRSQNSIQEHKDGKYYAHGYQYRYVEVKDDENKA